MQGWKCLLVNKSQLSQGREILRYYVKRSMPICLSTACAHWKVLDSSKRFKLSSQIAECSDASLPPPFFLFHYPLFSLSQPHQATFTFCLSICSVLCFLVEYTDYVKHVFGQYVAVFFLLRLFVKSSTSAAFMHNFTVASSQGPLIVQACTAAGSPCGERDVLKMSCWCLHESNFFSKLLLLLFCMVL